MIHPVVDAVLSIVVSVMGIVASFIGVKNAYRAMRADRDLTREHGFNPTGQDLENPYRCGGATRKQRRSDSLRIDRAPDLVQPGEAPRGWDRAADQERAVELLYDELRDADTFEELLSGRKQ